MCVSPAVYSSKVQRKYLFKPSYICIFISMQIFILYLAFYRTIKILFRQFWLSRNSEHFMKLKLYTYANDLQSAECSTQHAVCSMQHAACAPLTSPEVCPSFVLLCEKKLAKYLGQSLNNAMRMRSITFPAAAAAALVAVIVIVFPMEMCPSERNSNSRSNTHTHTDAHTMSCVCVPTKA